MDTAKNDLAKRAVMALTAIAVLGMVGGIVVAYLGQPVGAVVAIVTGAVGGIIAIVVKVLDKNGNGGGA